MAEMILTEFKEVALFYQKKIFFFSELWADRGQVSASHCILS